MTKFYNKAKNDQWEEQNVAMSVIARFGTGGGNTPVVINDMDTYSIQRSDEYKESGIASTIAERDYKSATDLIIGGMNTWQWIAEMVRKAKSTARCRQNQTVG